MGISVPLDEELGYPHELILSASNRIANVIRGRYRTRIKLLANLLGFILNKKSEKISVENEVDIGLLIFKNLSQSPRSLEKHLLKYKEKIETARKDFEETESEPSYVVLTDLLKDGIFFHILCRELNHKVLFSEKDLAKFSSLFINKDSDLQAVFSAIKIYESGKYDSVPQNIIAELNSEQDVALQRLAIYLSYSLAVENPKNKRELLISHYMLVKRTITQFREIINKENLADKVLENLFSLAIILSLCGYLTALRLPKDEKTRYIDEVIKLPSVEHSIKKSYDEVASISIPHIQIKVPLWMFLVFDVFLMVLHFFVELYLPWEIAQIGFKLEIPDVPVFLVIALVVTVFISFRLYKLRDTLLKNFRRETIE